MRVPTLVVAKLRSRVAVGLAATIIAMPAIGEDFDRSLLQGRWVELFEDMKPDCSDAFLFEHELNADGTILTNRYIRNWTFSQFSGPRVSEESMRVVRMTRDTLVVTRDAETDPGSPIEWEMRFASPDSYTLRAEHPEIDAAVNVKRQRCP
jgi:hypothetical protein